MDIIIGIGTYATVIPTAHIGHARLAGHPITAAIPQLIGPIFRESAGVP
jgi:hypothetical protein